MMRDIFGRRGFKPRLLILNKLGNCGKSVYKKDFLSYFKLILF